MKHRENHNPRAFIAVVNAVGETAYQSLMHILKDNGIALRVLDGLIQNGLDGRDEPRSETGAELLVSFRRLVKLPPSLSAKDNRLVHRSNRARASVLI